MKKYKDELVPSQKLSSVVCDCCKIEYKDELEINEFLYWKDTKGYGDKYFGDMNQVELDLCQICTYELLGKYVRVKKSDWEE
jgi:hypothetical protein